MPSIATRSEPLLTVNSLGFGKICALLPPSTKVRTMSRFFMSWPVANPGVAAATRRPLSVDHVGREASAGDFLQAADQELQVDHSGDHSQKTVAVFHRIADQKHGAGCVAFADDQGLAVVFAAIAGGGIGALEFAVQEGIRSDAFRRKCPWRLS